jgi:AraC-like DNA-binding protein
VHGELVSELALGTPHGALRSAVRRYCGYREHSATPLVRREVPRGGVTLIVSFGDPIRLRRGVATTTHRSFLAGLHDRHVLTDFSGGQHGVQVDLTPLGAYRLLGVPMRELANTSAALDELPHRRLADLADRLAEAPSWAERLSTLDRTLLDWSRDWPAADPEVSWVWRRLARSGGRAQIGTLATEVGWSRRHLAARFREQVGLAPKPTARVLRFRRAAALLRRSDSGTISDAAAACGYADHAHLTREFGELAGCTPSDYRAGR